MSKVARKKPRYIVPWIPLQGYASFLDTLLMALNSLRINLGPNTILFPIISFPSP